MKATQLLACGLLAACLTLFAPGSAIAGPGPKVVSKSPQPVGAKHKVSSFAPHPTTRRVFGDPIQPPIMGHVAPKKKQPPQ